jgi:hypothetical protein
MTNYEKIKSMSLEEMAEWIDRQYDQEREDWFSLGCYNCINYGTHHCPKDCGECEWLGGIKQWLQQEIRQS